MFRQIEAILWAQWRTMRNYYPRAGKGGLALTALILAIWYGMWAFGAFSVYLLVSDPESKTLLQRFLSLGLFLSFLYWQVIPIMMAGTGMSLDLRRLLVYPIPSRHLFAVEVLLRCTTAVEMLLMLGGAALGLMTNPAVPWWAPVPLLPFVLTNLFLSAGIRDLLTRIFARKGAREIAVIFMVLAAGLPQLLLMKRLPQGAPRSIPAWVPSSFWPWGAAADIAMGKASPGSWAVLLGWALVTYGFGRSQFERGLKFDAEAARATRAVSTDRKSLLEGFFHVPNIFLRDPLAALVEKDLRFLVRAPRFRLVFLMGFTFGLLVWLPITLGRGQSSESIIADNFLTFVCVYALMLLGEVTIWNSFGFDRSAAQAYYAMPVPFRTVLVGKNITALIFIFLEVTLVMGICSLIRMPASPQRVFEAYAVTLVFAIYLLSIGNLVSVRSPKAVNPAQSWRSGSASKFQAMLLLIYPVLAVPVLLAYAARYAFETEAAFYAVLAVTGLVGGMLYYVALDSALETAKQRTEEIVTALTAGEGLVR